MAIVLIIDDDAMVRDVLREMLECTGHAVTEACTGREGLQRFRTASPDLVITDLQLPEIRGLELIEALLQDCPTAKIIAISGSGEDLLARAKHAGAARSYTKPLDFSALLTAVQALIQPGD